MYINNKTEFVACHVYLGLRRLAEYPNHEDSGFRHLATDTLIRFTTPENIEELRETYKQKFDSYPEDHLEKLLKVVLNFCVFNVCCERAIFQTP